MILDAGETVLGAVADDATLGARVVDGAEVVGGKVFAVAVG